MAEEEQRMIKNRKDKLIIERRKNLETTNKIAQIYKDLGDLVDNKIKD